MKILKVIQPEKCVIEDFEILAFEDEEQLKFYTVWHEALIDGKSKVVPNAVTKLAKHPTSSSPRRKPTASRRTTAPIRPSEPTSIPSVIETGLHQRQGAAPLPNGLTLISTLQSINKQSTTRYKLTKLYNKYRGQQLRRNYVAQKEKNARIENEVAKSYINSWLAYTALQALHIPETPAPTTIISNNTNNIGKPNQKTPKQTSLKQNKGWALFYIDPVNMITYSNRICPQQVAAYKHKSRQLPSNASSKKSSAASYDAFEVMEVLANTNKTNVTITRNANRPTQPGSVYSHSVNPNTPGIVSTQLHLQARSYLDSMAKFYEEERVKLQQEQEELENGPSHEELVNRYLKIY